MLIDVVWPLTNPNRVVDVAFKLLINNIEPVNNEFILLNIVVNVLFKLLIDNIELVDNEFKFVVVAYMDKLGVLITVELQSAGKYDGLPSIFVHWRCVNPVALPYKHWFESMVKASVLLVNIVSKYLLMDIPLIPLKLISGVVFVVKVVVNVNAWFNWVDLWKTY